MGEEADIWIKTNLKETSRIIAVCLDRYAEVAIKSLENLYLQWTFPTRGLNLYSSELVQQSSRNISYCNVRSCHEKHNLSCFMDAMK